MVTVSDFTKRATDPNTINWIPKLLLIERDEAVLHNLTTAIPNAHRVRLAKKSKDISI